MLINSQRFNSGIKLLQIKRIRRFEREYSLPLIFSIVFFLAILLVVYVRYQERSTLTEISAEKPVSGQAYSDLLSNDKALDLKNSGSAGDSQSSSSLTGQVPTASRGSGAGGAASKGPFSSSISSFQHVGTTRVCDNPNPSKGTCSNRYVFSSGVRTVNGPGTVSYSWVSSQSGASSNGSFSAGSGDITTTLQKEITLPCNKPGTFNLRINLSSPSAAQSGTITIVHACII